MKKILSIVLTLMMAFSMFTTVSAATVKDLLPPEVDGSTALNPYLLYELPIEIQACESDLDSYQGSPLNISGKALGTEVGVDFKATLKMDAIRTLFDTDFYISELENDSDAKTEFNAGQVTTEVTVTVAYPGVTVNTAEGELTGDSASLYVEKAREQVEDNKIAITFENRADLKANELNKTVLSDVVFELKDAAVYKTEGEHNLVVTMSGFTKIDFTSVDLYVGYKDDGSGLYTVNLDYLDPSRPSGGASRYSITYETNDGTQADRETYARNATVKLTKVPVREGYIFEGWYLDKELTQRVTEIKLTKNTTLYAKWVEDNGTAGNGHETPEILNGEDHFAYVVGYPDGTVKPNDNISRAEVTTIFFRLLKETERDAALANSNNFSDVNEGDWYNTAVSTMAKLGIVNGRAADEFVPNAFITRAEFAAICARLDDSEFEATDDFADVSGHWAENEIHEAAAHGWIRGYEDNTFKPDQFITRAEAMTMINRVLNRIPETAEDLLDSMKQWSDNSNESAWYYLPVQEATNSHDYDMKNHIYEKWTALKDDIDWAKYE